MKVKQSFEDPDALYQEYINEKAQPKTIRHGKVCKKMIVNNMAKKVFKRQRWFQAIDRFEIVSFLSHLAIDRFEIVSFLSHPRT